MSLWAIDARTYKAAWPLRVAWDSRSSPGYVVWRDVFEGHMKCSLAEAVATHKEAEFVCESRAVEYAEWRNQNKARGE